MDVGAIAAFWLVTLVLIIAPGADWAFVLGAALRGNAVLSAVGGLVVGYSAITAVVAAGVGEFVADSPAALTVITVVGGGYLIWLGVTTLRRPSTPPASADSDARSDGGSRLTGTGDAGARSNRGTVVEGIGVSGLNAKGLLIFVALLPQFTSAGESWPLTAQMVVLGLVFTLTCAGFYLVLGTFAATVLRARPVAARALTRASGLGMLIIGTVLLADALLS